MRLGIDAPPKHFEGPIKHIVKPVVRRVEFQNFVFRCAKQGLQIRRDEIDKFFEVCFGRLNIHQSQIVHLQICLTSSVAS